MTRGRRRPLAAHRRQLPSARVLARRGAGLVLGQEAGAVLFLCLASCSLTLPRPCQRLVTDDVWCGQSGKPDAAAPLRRPVRQN